MIRVLRHCTFLPKERIELFSEPRIPCSLRGHMSESDRLVTAPTTNSLTPITTSSGYLGSLHVMMRVLRLRTFLPKERIPLLSKPRIPRSLRRHVSELERLVTAPKVLCLTSL